MKRSKTQVCALCGELNQVTREHVPPKCLFPTPQRQPLILWTCLRCNNGSSADDEEFGAILNLLANDPTSDDGPHWERSIRTLRKQKKLVRSLLKSTEEILLSSQSGIVVGPGFGFRWPVKRLLATAEKVARLLYFKEHQKPVPKDFDLATFGFDAAGKPLGKELLRRSALMDLAQDCAIGITERPEIFSYRWGVATDQPAFSVWITTYMKRVVFVTFISPLQPNSSNNY